MKKIFLFLILALCVKFVFAQEIVGKYTAMGFENNIEAVITDKGVFKVWIAAPGYEKKMLKIQGESDLNSFVQRLRECKEKYVEWSNVAKVNNVTNFLKKFDVSFPKVEIWWRGSEWFSTYQRDYFKPSFMVSENGIVFIVSEEVAHWDNKYIDTDFLFILGSAEDFNSLINALDVEKIKGALAKKENIGDLFQ